MTRDDLRQLLAYHYWARDRVLAAAAPLPAEQYTKPMGSSFTSIRDTLNHIFLAEWIWLSRWQGRSPTAPPAEPIPDVASLRTRWEAQETQVRAFLEGLDEAGLSRVIPYTLLNGQAGASPFWQMLVHVVNHAGYHRGQVATMLRQLGAAPAQSTDLITFFREQQG